MRISDWSSDVCASDLEDERRRSSRTHRRGIAEVTDASNAMTDAELAAHIAHVAGDLLLSLQRSGLFQGKALGRAGDRTANAFIMEALRATRPDDAVLSEAEKDNAARRPAERRVGKECVRTC